LSFSRWRQLRWKRWLQRRIPPSSSVLLDQRRIFIIPSRTGAAFGGALILMLLAGINYQNSLAYGLTFFLMAVFVVAILHTYRNLAGLTLQAAGSAPVFVGEHAAFRIRLLSNQRTHQAIALSWPPAPGQVLDVPAQAVVECQLDLPALQRGWLRPQRLRVESQFPLGLLMAWSWVDLDQAALVYPRPLSGSLPLSAGAGQDHQDHDRRQQHAECDKRGPRHAGCAQAARGGVQDQQRQPACDHVVPGHCLADVEAQTWCQLEQDRHQHAAQGSQENEGHAKGLAGETLGTL